MPIAQQFLSEFEAQATITRRYLERLPADKLTWKPHEKSMTAGQLALHIALVRAGFCLLCRTIRRRPRILATIRSPQAARRS